MSEPADHPPETGIDFARAGPAAGPTPETAERARREANAQLHRPGIDLVLLDIVLPDADGLQILRRVREHPRLANLPVIMMTGKVAPEDVLAGLAAGADGYVTKPFRMSALVNAVNVVLGNA